MKYSSLLLFSPDRKVYFYYDKSLYHFFLLNRGHIRVTETILHRHDETDETVNNETQNKTTNMLLKTSADALVRLHMMQHMHMWMDICELAEICTYISQSVCACATKQASVWA